MKAIGTMIILAGALLCACAHAPQGPQWNFLGESGKGSAFYIDPESVSHPAEGIVQMWVKMVPSESESIHTYLMALVDCGIISFDEDVKKTENIAYSVILYEIDCVKDSIISVASQDYDERGTMVESSTYDKKIIQMFAGRQPGGIDISVPDGTIWEVLRNTACEIGGGGTICMARDGGAESGAVQSFQETTPQIGSDAAGTL